MNFFKRRKTYFTDVPIFQEPADYSEWKAKVSLSKKPLSDDEIDVVFDRIYSYNHSKLRTTLLNLILRGKSLTKVEKLELEIIKERLNPLIVL